MNFGQLVSVLMSVLLIGGGLPAAAQDKPAQEKTGGVSANVMILRDQKTIDKKLSDNTPWKTENVWRRDPVTVKGGPIKQMPPTAVQQVELFEAIDNVVSLPQGVKDEFKLRIQKGDCQEDVLPTRYFEKMVNGTKSVEKVIIEEKLAGKTKACYFFFETINQPVFVVYDCGNFLFPYTDITYPSNPVAANIPAPSVLTCSISPTELLLRSRAETGIFDLKVSPPVDMSEASIDWFVGNKRVAANISQFELLGSMVEADVSTIITAKVAVGRREVSCTAQVVLKFPPPTPVVKVEPCPTCKIIITGLSKKAKLLNNSDPITLTSELLPADAIVQNEKWTMRTPGEKDPVTLGTGRSIQLSINQMPHTKKGKLIAGEWYATYQAEYIGSDGKICKVSCTVKLVTTSDGWNKGWLIAVVAVGVIVAAFLLKGKKVVKNPVTVNGGKP